MRLLHWISIVLFTIFTVSVDRIFSLTQYDCQVICTRTVARTQQYQANIHFLNGLYNYCLRACMESVDKALPATSPRPTTLRPTRGSTQQPTTGAFPTACGVSDGIQGRIIGGRDARQCEFPWVVGVNITESSPNWCGGTILDTRHILTAAHCLLDRDYQPWAVENIRVWVGSSLHRELNEFPVQWIDVSPSYNPTNKDYDMAIVTLKEDLVFSACIKPICLPEVGETTEDSLKCTIAGWGATSDSALAPFQSAEPTEYLQKVDVRIVPNSICISSYDIINDRRMCAGDYENGGKDSCIGDSGGPLMCQVRVNSYIRYIQYGIVSFGSGCGSPKLPGVYMRVSHPDVRNFILNITHQ